MEHTGAATSEDRTTVRMRGELGHPVIDVVFSRSRHTETHVNARVTHQGADTMFAVAIGPAER